MGSPQGGAWIGALAVCSLLPANSSSAQEDEMGECGSPGHILELSWAQGTSDPSLWVQSFLIRDTRGPHGCVTGVATTHAWTEGVGQCEPASPARRQTRG